MQDDMGKCRISIIVPVYNTEQFLERCIDSILIQDFSDYEIVIVDDGSTDRSPEICDGYASRYPNVKVLHKPNGGVSSARNLGVEMSEGDYVMFVDSDDTITPDALSSMMSVSDDGHADFIVGALDILMNEKCVYRLSVHGNVFYPDSSIEDFWVDNLGERGELFMGPCAKLYRRSLLNQYKVRFDESLCYSEDKLFVYTYLRYISTAAATSSVTYLYDHREDTLSGVKLTERRVAQLLAAIPKVASAFLQLAEKYGNADCFMTVYHNDIVCGNAMRVLRYFMKSRTALMNESSLSSLYSVMDKDAKLKIFERNVPGQILSVVLYHLCSISVSLRIYRMISSLLSRFYV